jgi:hypothetical protein
MLLSLVGAIFGALKGWVIWWCWDVLGAVLSEQRRVLCIEACYSDKAAA